MASDAQAKGAWVLETASMIAGTVMQGTHPLLRKWFLAAYLRATHSNSISALQLQPELGVSTKPPAGAPQAPAGNGKPDTAFRNYRRGRVRHPISAQGGRAGDGWQQQQSQPDMDRRSGRDGRQPWFRLLGRRRRHFVLHVERFFDCLRIPGDGPKESIRSCIRFRTALLPVSKRCQIKAIPHGERLLGQLRAIPNFANAYRPRRMNLRDHSCGREFVLQCSQVVDARNGHERLAVIDHLSEDRMGRPQRQMPPDENPSSFRSIRAV